MVWMKKPNANAFETKKKAKKNNWSWNLMTLKWPQRGFAGVTALSWAAS
jgi:hypothetical protein